MSSSAKWDNNHPCAEGSARLRRCASDVPARSQDSDNDGPSLYLYVFTFWTQSLALLREHLVLPLSSWTWGNVEVK